MRPEVPSVTGVLVCALLLLKSPLRAKTFFNTSLVAVCDQTNSGLVTSPLGSSLLMRLKAFGLGCWAELPNVPNPL